MLLLSLRPRFANAILSGDKTVELRRRPINAQAESRVILYASSPVMAVVGTARLAGIDVSDPEAAWQRHHAVLGLEREEFDRYLDGSSAAYMLQLRDVHQLDEPLLLHRLREDAAFQPPQSFRYVAPSDPARLRRLARPQDQNDALALW